MVVFCLDGKQVNYFNITSVCRMAARCSLAVRDSLSTSICCLQSEFWLLRVSSFVCKASSSDSFFDNSCFSWSICPIHTKKNLLTSWQLQDISTMTFLNTYVKSLRLWGQLWSPQNYKDISTMTFLPPQWPHSTLGRKKLLVEQ